MKTNLRHLLYKAVISRESNAIVASFQRYCGVTKEGKATNKVIYFYFKLSSALGEEVFSLIPLLWWTQSDIAMRFMNRFLLLMGMGQFVKDFMELPRPKEGSQGVVKLERHFDTEYGFPSTHTISGFLPITYMLDLIRIGVIENHPKYYVFGLVWLLSIMASRVYVGVHSIVDIIGGLVLGAVAAWFLQIDKVAEVLEFVFVGWKYGILVSSAVVVLLLRYFPKARPWRAGFGTLMMSTGPWYGCCISLWVLRYILPPSVEHELKTLGSQKSFSDPKYLGCVLLGLLAILITKTVTTKLGKAVFVFLFKNKMLPYDSREGKGPDGKLVPPEKAYSVEVPVRLISYACVGIMCVLVTPLATLWLKEKGYA